HDACAAMQGADGAGQTCAAGTGNDNVKLFVPKIILRLGAGDRHGAERGGGCAEASGLHEPAARNAASFVGRQGYPLSMWHLYPRKQNIAYVLCMQGNKMRFTRLGLNCWDDHQIAIMN